MIEFDGFLGDVYILYNAIGGGLRNVTDCDKGSGYLSRNMTHIRFSMAPSIGKKNNKNKKKRE